MSELVYFADGPKCGVRMAVESVARPILFECFDRNEFASYATLGGDSGEVLVKRGVVAYRVDRHAEYVGPYIRRLLHVATESGPVDAVQLFGDRHFLDYRDATPWEVYQPKGSEDFDSWWAMRMIELGRENCDELAYQWSRQMRA